MKRAFFVIVIVLGVLVIGFLAYSIPHANRITAFEKNVSSAITNVESDSAGLRGNQGVEAFCRALDDIQTQALNIPRFKKEQSGIQESSNFIRDLWKKTKIKSDDIDQLNEQVDALYSLVSPGIIATLDTLLTGTAESFRSGSDLQGIDATASQFNSDLIRMTNSIKSFESHATDPVTTSVFPSAGKVDLSILLKMKQKLQDGLTPGVSKIAALTQTASENESKKVESAQSVRDAVEIIKAHISWLEAARKSISVLAQVGAARSTLSSADEMITQHISRAKSDIALIERVIKAQKQSNDIMNSSLQLADTANNSLQNMERFADSNQIMNVYNQWNAACTAVEHAKSALYISSSGSHEQMIADNLLSKSRAQVAEISNKLGAHRDFVYSQYEEARQQESTVVGSVTRSVQRGWDRFKSFVGGVAQRAAESRIGREISISVKALILGTKAFYDLLDPNTDPVSWAFSYQSDVDKLMNETDEVMRMEGPSLTGKNTFIEDFVNRSYEKAFNKENELAQKSSSHAKENERSISEGLSSEIFANKEIISEQNKEFSEDRVLSKIEIKGNNIKEEKVNSLPKPEPPIKESVMDKKALAAATIPAVPTEEHLFLEKFIGKYESVNIFFIDDNTLGITLPGFGDKYKLAFENGTNFAVLNSKGSRMGYSLKFGLNEQDEAANIIVFNGSQGISYDKTKNSSSDEIKAINAYDFEGRWMRWDEENGHEVGYEVLITAISATTFEAHYTTINNDNRFIGTLDTSYSTIKVRIIQYYNHSGSRYGTWELQLTSKNKMVGTIRDEGGLYPARWERID